MSLFKWPWSKKKPEQNRAPAHRVVAPPFRTTAPTRASLGGGGISQPLPDNTVHDTLFTHSLLYSAMDNSPTSGGDHCQAHHGDDGHVSQCDPSSDYGSSFDSGGSSDCGSSFTPD